MDQEGGGVFAAAFHNQDPNVILLGQDIGGIDKTTDGGLTWRHVNSQGFARPEIRLDVFFVDDLTAHPTDNDLFFAATGAGLFRSRDIGETPSQPVLLTLTDGQIGSEFNYSITARSSVRLETSNPPGATSVGSVRVTPDLENSAPSGLGIFSFLSGGVRVAEAGVPALGISSEFRMYAEVSGTPGAIGSLRSGVAIANTVSSTVTATFELTELDGTSTGMSESRTIPPSGQLAAFIDELFTGLTVPFQEGLRITSAPSAVAVIGLRARTNARGDFMITTTPPTDEAGPLQYHHMRSKLEIARSVTPHLGPVDSRKA